MPSQGRARRAGRSSSSARRWKSDSSAITCGAGRTPVKRRSSAGKQTGQTPVKLVLRRLDTGGSALGRLLPRPSNAGQTPVKHWSNTGQTPAAKHWSNPGQTLVKYWSSTGQILITYRPDAGQTRVSADTAVRPRSATGQKCVGNGPDTGRTRVKRGSRAFQKRVRNGLKNERNTASCSL